MYSAKDWRKVFRGAVGHWVKSLTSLRQVPHFAERDVASLVQAAE
jgi:hypothetical protein